MLTVAQFVTVFFYLSWTRKIRWLSLLSAAVNQVNPVLNSTL